IELKEGVKPSEELKQDLISFCQQNLAKFKCPRKIEFMDALPRSDAGKIQRRKVRDIYIPAA
ncbi:MAG TPA: hypothetical protein PKN18_04725, partial [Pseudomonadales bacterium]|nr:hypothetical protein [Pseudomonadales bacterium]